jgi:Protein of unknown function (DUF1565)
MACGGSDDRPTPDGPAEPAPDAAVDGAVDAPPPAPVAILVAKDGNDTHDGIHMPVETLKRALAIAAADPRVTEIVMGAGSYTTRDGETFPYTVPPRLEIAGPVDGGVILVGTDAETGLVFSGGGQLQGVELDHFKLAIDASGELRLKNVRIASSAAGVLANASARLRITDLDLTGPTSPGSACPEGIFLAGAAELMVTTLTAQGFLPTLAADGPAVIDIAGATISAPAAVSSCQRPSIDVTGLAAFKLSDTTIDGGGKGGVKLVGDPNRKVQAILTNTSVRNAAQAIAARSIDLQMTDGTLSSNGFGFVGDTGAWSFTHVFFTATRGVGIQVLGAGVEAPGLARLTMRNCLVAGSDSSGIELQANAAADLGTTESPGNNVFDSNRFVGLNIAGPGAPSVITAIGNTWRENTQGSDAQGHYPRPELVSGPIALDIVQNYAIAAGWTLQR